MPRGDWTGLARQEMLGWLWFGRRQEEEPVSGGPAQSASDAASLEAATEAEADFETPLLLPTRGPRPAAGARPPSVEAHPSLGGRQHPDLELAALAASPELASIETRRKRYDMDRVDRSRRLTKE